MVDLLFRNSQNLAKVSLNGRLHSTVTLDGLQMPYTQDDQGGGGQDYSQLQNSIMRVRALVGRFSFILDS